MNKKIEIIACEIENLITQMQEKQHSHNERELRQLLKESEVINFNQITITECHVISTIDTLEEANGIRIAEKLKMTRGGVSKIATRLMEKNLITTYKSESNQKKVFYTLTPIGQKVNDIHKQLHKENHNSLCNIVSSYTSQEQDVILRFIKDLQNNNLSNI